jgi:hypothetical protein
MAEGLFRGLLRGDDPRQVLAEVRRELFLADRERAAGPGHDWASLVAYAALPDDLDDQVVRSTIYMARRAVDAEVARFDRYLARRGTADPTSVPEFERAIGALFAAAKSAPAREAETLAFVGFARRRHAEALFAVKDKATPAVEDAAWRALNSARDLYRAAFWKDPRLLWALVRSLVLGALNEYPLNAGEATLRDFAGAALRGAATAGGGLTRPRNELDLALIAPQPPPVDEVRALLRQFAIVGGSFEGYSFRRHLERVKQVARAPELVDRAQRWGEQPEVQQMPATWAALADDTSFARSGA